MTIPQPIEAPRDAEGRAYELFKGMWTRPWTMDRGIIGEIERCYGTLDLYDKKVLDIGGNIGAFATWASVKGAKSVHCFEPAEDNFKLLELNVARFNEDQKRIWIKRAAIVDDDQKLDADGCVPFFISTSGKNPANYSSVPTRGRTVVRVPAFGWDEVLSRNSFDVIKIDCEGAEFDFLHQPFPACVKQVAMEIHLNGRGRAKMPELLARTGLTGWRVRTRPYDTGSNWTTIGVWSR